MKNRTQFIAGALMMATMAGTGITFAAGNRNPKENSAQDRRIQNLEYLSKAKKDVSAISTGVDGLLKAVKEAKASDDKTKMKGVLDASEKHLMGMKTHTESCMKHMESLEAEMSKDAQVGGATAEKAP
ncbi:MAG: hypothetical protein ABIW76_12550 [Fibrobacteria bacterium]